MCTKQNAFQNKYNKMSGGTMNQRIISSNLFALIRHNSDLTRQGCPLWRYQAETGEAVKQSWLENIHPILSWWRHEMETVPRYWPFVRGIHQSPLFPLICAWRKTVEHTIETPVILRRHRAHYDVTIMVESHWLGPASIINQTQNLLKYHFLRISQWIFQSIIYRLQC